MAPDNPPTKRTTPPRMSPEEYAERLDSMHSRLNRLSQADLGPSSETLEDLKVALEELRVADEELRQQNDELAAAHLMLDHERRRYEELFEFAPNAYLVTDPFGIVQQANRSAAGLFGVRAQFLPGKALATYV